MTSKSSSRRSFVYVLGSRDKGRALTYVGWTLDVARRLAQHNSGTGAAHNAGAHLGAAAYRRTSHPERGHEHGSGNLKRDRAFRKKLLAKRKLGLASESMTSSRS